ncbi:CAP domain-containing protein, partial [Mycena galopus ATCC 62051]
VLLLSSVSVTGIPTDGEYAKRATPAEKEEYLSVQNAVRAQHGAVALKWNDEAGAKADEWAHRCVFVHQDPKVNKFGENLAAGTAPDYNFTTAVTAWAAEASQYNSTDPQPSHFTQLVWKATTEVGCAVAICDKIFASGKPAKFYVCEYFPKGNIQGQYP